MDEKLVSHIKQAEGTGPRNALGHFLIYQDHLGHDTVGWGHLVANGFDPEVMELQLTKDIERAISLARQIDYFDALDPVRQRAVVDLVFNLGYAGLQKFVKFHAAMRIKDYTLAAAEIKDSRYYVQTGRRGALIYEVIKAGVWPGESAADVPSDRPSESGGSGLVWLWVVVGLGALTWLLL